MSRPLRFHWSLSQAGDKFRRAQARESQTALLSLDEQLKVCRRAEECGIDSMLMAIGFNRPDPALLSVALGLKTEKIKFMVACRSGLLSPTLFVQQVNTASMLINGRICVNMVCGHTPYELNYYGDFLSHDERYERTGEFLTICRGFWGLDEAVNFTGKYYCVKDARINIPFVSDERRAPEIFLGGNSPQAAALAVEHASCLWRFADTPEKLRPHIEPVLQAGVEVGLLVSLIARPTREEAVRAASSLIEKFGEETRQVHRNFAAKSDSVGFRATYALASEDEASNWLTPYLWAGAVPFLGAPAIALVGSFEEVAEAIWGYQQLGASQFLFMGWPDVDEIAHFGGGVLPLIRSRERETNTRTGSEV